MRINFSRILNVFGASRLPPISPEEVEFEDQAEEEVDLREPEPEPPLEPEVLRQFARAVPLPDTVKGKLFRGAMIEEYEFRLGQRQESLHIAALVQLGVTRVVSIVQPDWGVLRKLERAGIAQEEVDNLEHIPDYFFRRRIGRWLDFEDEFPAFEYEELLTMFFQIQPPFKHVIELLENGYVIYLHCEQGVQRTGDFVRAILNYYDRGGLGDVHEKMVEKIREMEEASSLDEDGSRGSQTL